MVEAALAGIGIAWLPEHAITEHLSEGRLIDLLPRWSPFFPGLCLYYPANRHPPAALRLFSESVREWASTQNLVRIVRARQNYPRSRAEFATKSKTWIFRGPSSAP
jgi:hypothetical protein